MSTERLFTAFADTLKEYHVALGEFIARPSEANARRMWEATYEGRRREDDLTRQDLPPFQTWYEALHLDEMVQKMKGEN